LRNRILSLTVLLAGAAVVAAIAYSYLPAFRGQLSPAPKTDSLSKTGAETSAQPLAAGTVRLTTEQIKEFGVETAIAGSGTLQIEVVLPGEVALNADRVAHVVPRIAGVVREVRKNLGETVRRGEVMAVLESRELADSRATLLAARERVALAQSNFAREERLWLKKISPEQDYIQAKNGLAEANIGLRTAEQKLRALGFSEDYLNQLSSRQDNAAVLYEITAPFDATVTEKHASLGEVLKEDSPAFVIADLSTVWVNLDIHQKDLPFVRVGQKAIISVGGALADVTARVNFLEPIATETNRTIHARVVLPNAEGRYRPGLFVSGRIVIDDLKVAVLVPNDALVLVEGQSSLFIKEGDSFHIRAIAAGRSNSSLTEIVRGLEAGDVYVKKGAFTLKSELGKPAAD
jgi:membrane fusion protein, heavy metal efflux system